MSGRVRYTLVSEKFKETFVKIGARPAPRPEDLKEINYLSSKTWIPNKVPKEETITITIYENIDQVDLSQIPTLESNQFCDFKLKLYNKWGDVMDIWHLKDAYISTIEYSEINECLQFHLNYKSSLYENIPIDYSKYLNRMGLGTIGEVTCPQCTHKFKV